MSNSISQTDSIDIALKKHVQAFHAIRSIDLEKKRTWMEKWLHNKEYQVYHSPRDLIRWLEWARPDDCAAHYLPEDRVTPLTDASERESRRILEPLLKGDYKFRHVDEYNAVDFLFQNLYPVPERMRPKRVLDFGAGYGRQMNLWSRVHNLTYVAVDSIELSYALQSFYLNQFGLPVWEYANGSTTNIGATPGIYHLPTWRCDLLPDAFFDLVICTHVLVEIPAAMVYDAIHTFRRCVKPGGAVYIRDHGLAVQEMHHIDIDEVLSRNGFTLEFRPYVLDYVWWIQHQADIPPDIGGIPRIFRRIDSRYPLYKPPGTMRRIRHVVSEADRRCGGLLHRLLTKGKNPEDQPGVANN